jgi:hypothetical protein
MNPITYEALRADPELRQALLQQAHRARNEAINRLIFAPIKAFLTRRHAARTHFVRQG